MASLFVTKNDVAGRRAVSNGGLGGFVTIGSIIVRENHQGDSKSTWPKNRRKKDKPPPISIVQESDKFFVKQDFSLPTRMAEDRDILLSPRTPISRYNLLLTSSVYSDHLPPSPLTPKQQLLPSALELPGSLLLPSQGFAQSNPPCTPPRPPPRLSRSSSEESDRIWTPAVSISSTTDVEDDDMPKSFPPKHLPRGPKPSKPRNFLTTAVQERSIGKPISAMTAEELLDELPQLNTEAVKTIWIPAMIKEHNRIKTLLQEAATVRLDTDSEVLHLGQVGLPSSLYHFSAEDAAQILESLSRDAHNISHTYEKAVQSVESLVERDAKSCRSRLEVTQHNLEAALNTIDNNHQALREKDEVVQHLRYKLDDVVRVLGDFIQDYTPLSILRDVEQADMRYVMQIIADYKNAILQADESTIHFLRVPEEHYLANVDAIREAHLKIERFREVAISQNQMISEQSHNLDEKLAAYEKSLNTIAERNQEVEMLLDDNKQLRKTVEDFETGVRVSNSTRVVQDELFKDQEAMQTKLRNMQASHAKEPKQKDTVIAGLEKKLGSAKEEVVRDKADAKNIITMKQALELPEEQQEDSTQAVSPSRERRMLSKAKGKSTGLPTNQSMHFFGPILPKAHAPTIPERGQAANTPAGSLEQRKFAILPRDVTPQWACGGSQKQDTPELRDLSNFSPTYAPHPRTNSLERSNGQQPPASGNHAVASAVVENMMRGPKEFDPIKRLPKRPEPHYALDLYGGHNAATMDHIEEWYEPQEPQLQTQPPTCVLAQPIFQRKRVLSQITERSGEDSASASEKALDKDSASATSSAQEEYVHGLQDVRLSKLVTETNHILGKGKERNNVPDYEGRDYYAAEAETHLMEAKTGVAKIDELVQSPAKLVQQSPAKLPQQGKMYQTSQDSSSSTITKKSSPLRDVEGIRIDGDPWLSGSPARRLA